MNKVILMGRLTRDPEVRYSSGDNQMAIARYSLAVDRRGRRDGDGQTADFINCVAFGKAAEFAEKYFHKGIKIAIGSSSKNTPIILKQIGLDNYFDAVSDGNNITKSKPDPEVFLKAADMLGVAYEDCMIVEDADAGIEAGKAAGMKTLAVNKAQGGDMSVENLGKAMISEIAEL